MALPHIVLKTSAILNTKCSTERKLASCIFSFSTPVVSWYIFLRCVIDEAPCALRSTKDEELLPRV